MGPAEIIAGVSVPSTGRSRRRPWYRRHLRERLIWVFAGAATLAVLLFSWQAWQASQSLRLAANQADLIGSQIVAGNAVGAQRTLMNLQESTSTARRRTDGPLWSLGAKVPILGNNIGAVQRVSEVVDEVAMTALPPVVELAAQINLNTFTPRDGTVDVAAIEQVRPTVEAAKVALGRATDRLADVDTTSLLVPLRGPVGRVKTKIAGAHGVAADAALAARLLPSMLGGKQARTYVLMVQNNAEARSTGGIAGSFALLTAKNGRLSMGFQGSLPDLAQFPEPVVAMTAEEKRLFAPSLVTNILDTNFTPDFPRTAQIVRAMAKKGLDVDVDGVISVDPVALSFVLGGTGPVELKDTPGVTLDQVNAVGVLLNSTYMLLADRQAQDDIFKQAARSIFDVLAEGRGDTSLVINGLVRGIAENRVMVWSRHASEQVSIAPSGLSGRLARDDGATPHVGVYLGDAASTKMEYYLEHVTSLVANRCLPGQVQELSSKTELRSRTPAKVTQLPEAVTGDGTFTPKGTMRLVVRLYSPYNGGFTAVSLDGKPQTVYADTHHGRNVTKVVLTLKPGSTHTISTRIISGTGQGKDAVLSTTPGALPQRNDRVVPSACR